jgi:putative hemolysin
MRMMNVGADSSTSFPKLSLSLASTHEDVREVQRLRYKVFVEAMGLETLKNHEGIERDEFDDVCDHLIVRDTRTLEVVGTYRVLSPRVLSQTGGFYSEQEFDLARLTNLRPRIMEAGRACIHPDYRSGGVIMMLWAGLAACMQREQAEYLIGCASVSLADGGHTINALYRKLAADHLSPPEYRVIHVCPSLCMMIPYLKTSRYPHSLKAICAAVLGFVVSQRGILIFIARIYS